MELSYWESRWRKNKTGFHLSETYEGLKKYWYEIQPGSISTVLVPLCGKSLDMIWLSGHTDLVIGVEISEKAITDFMSENNRRWAERQNGEFRVFDSGNIQIWQGNFFSLSPGKLPPIDLIYDKAALVALPENLRKRYAEKIRKLSSGETRYLLHHIMYNQEEMNGPPFSVAHEEITEYFEKEYQIEELNSARIDPGQFPKFVKRGLKTPITERLLLLHS